MVEIKNRNNKPKRMNDKWVNNQINGSNNGKLRRGNTPHRIFPDRFQYKTTLTLIFESRILRIIGFHGL
jgi:hypothetical protein